jgi:hypothetical protein
VCDIVSGLIFRVTSIDGLTTFELMQRALSAAYGLRGLLGSGNTYRVSSVVVGWTLLGVRLLGGLLSDVARGLSCRVRHPLVRLGGALVAGAMVGRIGEVVVVGDRRSGTPMWLSGSRRLNPEGKGRAVQSLSSGNARAPTRIAPPVAEASGEDTAAGL